MAGDDAGEWPTADLPASWRWTDFSTFFSDFTDSHRKVPQKAYKQDGRIAIVDQGAARIGGFTDDLSMQSSVPLPAVVFGDHTRAVKYIDVPFAQGADGVRVLAPNKQIEPEFAYQALRCVQLPDKGYSRHFKFLKASSFPLAPLSEQRRIVAKINSLTGNSKRARDHLDHIPRLVQKYKQAVLTATFRGVSPAVPHRKLRECTEFVTSGSRGWAKYYAKEGSLFIRVANVMRGHVDLSFSDIQRVAPPSGSEGERTLVRSGDIVITITADLGRIGIVPPNLGSAYVNQHVALVRLKETAHSPFIAWYLTSEIGQQQLLEKTRGATRAGLGLDDIRDVDVPLPPCIEQTEIVRRIKTTFAWINRLAADATSARKLINHFDHAVLAKAFRGELVPQDPSDEPSSVLLERIRAEAADTPQKVRVRRTSCQDSRT